jgi:coenzyme PQQ synthesis protein D (PqqD)
LKIEVLGGADFMSISFTERLILPEEVLVSNIEGESVLLNLNSERYFGLDDVGTRMLSVLTESDSIETAYEVLLAEYEVENETLRQDLADLIDRLIDQGLLEIAREQPAKV